MNTNEVWHRRESPQVETFYSASKRILYVDDEEVIRQMSAIALESAGYSVTTAANGWDAWLALNRGAFHLVVTDHNMPRLTGLQLIKRARLHGLAIPFIVASASTDSFRQSHHEWLDLAALLRKPFKPEELLGLVRQVLCSNYITQREAKTSASPL